VHNQLDPASTAPAHHLGDPPGVGAGADEHALAEREPGPGPVGRVGRSAGRRDGDTREVDGREVHDPL